MTRPLEDWRLREGLVKDEYASDVEFLGWHPGHTRCAVAIDLGEGLGTQNDRGWQTLTDCKSSVGGINACTHSKEPSWKVLLTLLLGKWIKECTYKCILLV